MVEIVRTETSRRGRARAKLRGDEFSLSPIHHHYGSYRRYHGDHHGRNGTRHRLFRPRPTSAIDYTHHMNQTASSAPEYPLLPGRRSGGRRLPQTPKQPSTLQFPRLTDSPTGPVRHFGGSGGARRLPREPIQPRRVASYDNPPVTAVRPLHQRMLPRSPPAVLRQHSLDQARLQPPRFFHPLSDDEDD